MGDEESSTISTRFLIISDTHNFEFEDTGPARPFRLPVPEADVLIHCGDLTHRGGLSAYNKAFQMFSSIQAELKLVIAGNHDVSMDREYWQSHCYDDDNPKEHSLAMKMWTGQRAAEAGVTYLTEGISTHTLSNGAKFTIYASPYTPEFCGWAFAYERNQDRFNGAAQVTEGVASIAKTPIPDFPALDIMVTHGPPKGILDECLQGQKGCEKLLRAVCRARPRMHCFGHIHEGYGTRILAWDKLESNNSLMVSLDCDNNEEQTVNPYPIAKECLVKYGEETLMVNGAIMSGDNEPNNAPWLLDIDIPRA
jgi:Calcineurin-like phosphoesterase